jgi:cytochrome P450
VGRVVAPVDFARWMPTPGEARFARSLKELQRIVDLLIEKRSQLKDGPHDMFSILSESGQSRTRMRDQFITMTMAGHETSAVALTWTYYCLSSLPGIDARVAQESARVLASGPATYETLEQLEYTTQVIHESLRLYPPVAIMGREAIEADELGGFAIPKDAVIALCPYATHRRADLWERPEEFDPSRFEPAQKEKQQPCSYVPFAAGPRGCIGQHLALFELQAAVSLISRRFRLKLETQGRIQPIPMVSMRPDRPIHMSLEARDGQS